MAEEIVETPPVVTKPPEDTEEYGKRLECRTSITLCHRRRFLKLYFYFCYVSFDNSDPDSSQDHDVENNVEKPVLASIAASMGWVFPQVKLESWNPENEEQWTVSIAVSLCVLL